MEILPIVSSLRRHKITAALLVLEIALTCAIVCNAVFLIGQRLQRTQIPSGVAEQQLVMVQIADIGHQDDAKARTQRDLAALRAIAGVKSVALINQLPFSYSSSNSGISLTADQKQPTLNTSMYFGENLVPTLGVRLVAGRDFEPDEYMDRDAAMEGVAKGDRKASSPTVIITRKLAERLWPGENPLGKVAYMGSTIRIRVVGVVANLIRPSLSNGDDTAEWSIVFPLRVNTGDSSRFVLRTDADQRQRVLEEAAATLRKLDPHRIILNKKTMQEMRRDFFRNDRAMAGTLLGVIIALLTVTALGIVGLASFWVAQRRKQIGIRRAVGATRGNILRYFQTENFLLATMGIALGMVLAFGLNLLLMRHYEIPRLPWIYLPVGAIALWLIGQLAVLGPALRAAAVPPVVATRSV